MSNLDNVTLIVKKIARVAAYPAVAQIVFGAISTTVPRRNMYEKLLVLYGSYAISSVVAEATAQHVEKKIEDAAEWYKKTSNSN